MNENENEKQAEIKKLDVKVKDFSDYINSIDGCLILIANVGTGVITSLQGKHMDLATMFEIAQSGKNGEHLRRIISTAEILRLSGLLAKKEDKDDGSEK